MAKLEPPQPPSQDRGEKSPEKARAALSVRGLSFRFARCLLIAYLLVILAMMFFERSLIFFPAVYPQGDWQPGGAEFEDASFTAADGTKLHGWFAGCDRPRAVVLLHPATPAMSRSGPTCSGISATSWARAHAPSTTEVTGVARAARRRRESWTTREPHGPGWRSGPLCQRKISSSWADRWVEA